MTTTDPGSHGDGQKFTTDKFERSICEVDGRVDILYGHDQPGNGNCRKW